MERAYREDELSDSLVIDSEGYIYGKAGKINIKEDEIEIIVYETKPDEKTAVDVEALIEELQKSVKPSFFARIRRLSPNQVLIQNVRSEFGLIPEEPLADEHYIKYAERLGLKLPYRRVTEERRESKGTITLADVKAIKTSTIEERQLARVIKVILLHEPKEAKFRKIPAQKIVPYRITETVKDKLVIDPSGRAVGFIDSVVLYSDGPGLRIYTSKSTESVSLRWLFAHLERISRLDIIEAIKKHLDISDLGTQAVEMELLGDFMKKTGLSFKVPDSAFLMQDAREFVMDIPWDLIDKIGDVVIIRQKLSELKSKGY